MRKIIVSILIMLALTICSNSEVYSLELDNICSNPFAERVRVTINFDTNGGNKIKELNYCSSCGSGSFKLPTPIRDGYKFVGWYADKNLTKKVNSMFIKGVDDKSIYIIPSSAGCNVNSGYTYLYAKWEKEEEIDITLKFIPGDNSIIEPINICSTCSVSKISLPALEKEGYIFLGWYAEPEFVNKIDIENSHSRDIYEKVLLENAPDNKDNSKRRYGTLYARWTEQEEIEYIMIDEIDNKISIINDLINR